MRQCLQYHRPRLRGRGGGGLGGGGVGARGGGRGGGVGRGGGGFTHLVPDESEPLDIVEEQPGHRDDHQDQEGDRHEHH